MHHHQSATLEALSLTPAAGILGITPKRLTYLTGHYDTWIKRGLIGPSGLKREGGQWRRFSVGQLIQFATALRLISYGCEATHALLIAVDGVWVVAIPGGDIQRIRSLWLSELRHSFERRCLIARPEEDGWKLGWQGPVDDLDISKKVQTDAVLIMLGPIANTVMDRYDELMQGPGDGELS